MIIKYSYLLIIVAPFLCSCNGYNLFSVYYDKSTKRFDVDYKSKVDSVEKFLKLYTDAYNERIGDFYPNYKNWKSLRSETMLNSQATLWVSNSRETLLSFDTSAAKQLIVKGTDYPIEMALILGLDVFRRYRRTTISAAASIKLYDSLPAFVGLGKYSYLQFSNGSSDGPMFRFSSTALALLDNYKYYGISHDSAIIQQGLITNVNGFDSLIDSAKSFGRIQAEQDIQQLFFDSKPFQKALVTQYLNAYATYMLNRFEKQKKNIEPYPFDEYQRNIDTLYRIGKSYGLSKDFVDSLYQFTSNTLPEYPGFYKNKDDLLQKWILVNLILFLIIVLFKPKIEKRFENLAWPVGFIQTINVTLLMYFYNVLDSFSLSFPFLIGITSSLYLSWSRVEKRFRL